MLFLDRGVVINIIIIIITPLSKNDTFLTTKYHLWRDEKSSQIDF